MKKCWEIERNSKFDQGWEIERNSKFDQGWGHAKSGSWVHGISILFRDPRTVNIDAGPPYSGIPKLGCWETCRVQFPAVFTKLLLAAIMRRRQAYLVLSGVVSVIGWLGLAGWWPVQATKEAMDGWMDGLLSCRSNSLVWPKCNSVL